MISVLIIGAGPAGMMAAVSAAEAGASVTLLERNPFPGKKLRITGKGRCNVTNNCSPREVVEAVTANPKFLYGAVSRFTPSDTIAFFENAGVPLKTERG
ncbi:MAG: NAD(P)/FAD-dependent oxidoreductase, partial [Clostridia bacterium]|nr:NAD(P)/FAD-dependent oxidoreductase [Clostridia bacterium]